MNRELPVYRYNKYQTQIIDGAVEENKRKPETVLYDMKTKQHKSFKKIALSKEL